jgi:hypothetical protein
VGSPTCQRGRCHTQRYDSGVNVGVVYYNTLRKTNRKHEDHIKQSFIEEILYPGSRPSPLVRPSHVLGDPIPCRNSTHLIPTFGLSLPCRSKRKSNYGLLQQSGSPLELLSPADIVIHVERSDSRNNSYRRLRCLLFPLAELEPAVPVTRA